MSLKATLGNDAKWTSRDWIFCNMCSVYSSALEGQAAWPLCTFHWFLFFRWRTRGSALRKSPQCQLQYPCQHVEQLSPESPMSRPVCGVRSIQLSTNVPVNKHPNILKWPEVREWLLETDRWLTPPGPLHQQEWLVPVDTRWSLLRLWPQAPRKSCTEEGELSWVLLKFGTSFTEILST